MSQLLGVFSPGFLLRSLFAGVFFFIAFFVAVPPTTTVTPAWTLGFGLPLSLFAGVATYTFHRSVIYAFVEWWLNSRRSRRWRKSVPLISRQTIQVLLSQWARAVSESRVSRERARHFFTWGDYAHLQYTSALCILFGAWSGAVVSKSSLDFYFPLGALGLVLFLAGVVADWRLHAIREYVDKLEAKLKKRARNGPAP